MIYCQPMGGLCNVMFQVAASISYANKYNTKYCLNHLKSHLNYVGNFYGKSWIPIDYEKYIFDGIGCECHVPNIPVYDLTYTGFSFMDLDLPNSDCMIRGYYQTEKYFINHKKHVLEKFKEKEEIKKIIDGKYGKYLKQSCTSIHVRRSDYLKYPGIYPIMTYEYYDKGLDLIGKETETILIFSDDEEWAKNNLLKRYKNAYVIENEKDYICMYLMARCKNNIIANSTFSWWGAYLNMNESKKVVAPEHWFTPSASIPYYDIVPEQWIKI